MGASVSNATIGQYPIWIDGRKIYCDEAKLNDHLTQNLKYNGNDAASIIEQIDGAQQPGI